MRLLFVVILHSVHALSMKSFGNSTLHVSSTAANVNSTMMTTDNSRDDCWASTDAWNSSFNLFYQSVSSARAAGRYSTMISTYPRMVTNWDYTYAAYTSKESAGYVMTTYVLRAITTNPPIQTIETITEVLEPEYTKPSPTCPCNSTQCTISANTVQLFYWPVNTLSGYLNHTVTSNATEPVTAVIDGTTFTSPTVYLSYDTVSAIDGCQSSVGTARPGAVLNMNPNALSSINSPHEYANTFNFADLNKPYSLNARRQMCWPTPLELCFVGVNDTYNPKLAVPEEIRALDPAWKDCDPDWLGSYDPPRILVPAQVLAQPTSAADDVKTAISTATPAHTVKSQRAASTVAPDAEILTSTSLASSPRSRSSNEMPAKSSPSKIPLAIAPPNQSLPALDPPDQKTFVKHTPAASSSLNEASSKNLLVGESSAKDPPAATSSVQKPPATDTPARDPSAEDSAARNLPTKTDPLQRSPVRDSLTVNPSEHNPPTQNMPVINIPTNDPPANDPSSRNPSANDLTTKNSPVNDPPSKTLAPEALGLVVGSTTEALVPVFGLPPLTIASQTYTTDASSQYIIASQTLTPNGKIVVSGTTISLLPSATALVIGSITKTLKPTFALPPFILDSKTYTADSGSQYIVNGQTLSPGGHVTMSGTLISLASEPSSLGKEANFGPPSSHLALPSLKIGSKIYTANDDFAYIVNDQTLTPDAQITVDGTPISLAPQASALVVGGKSKTLVPSYALPTITVGSKVYTANRDSAYIINGQTLTPGGQISVYGTSTSLATQASALKVGSKVVPLSFALPILTINSKLYTANPTAAYVINGQTLTLDGQISVDGTRISLAPKASALVIGSITEPLLGSLVLPPITIDSKVYVAISTSEYVIEEQTLTPGGHITVQGTPISMAVDTSVLFIGSSTQNLVAVSTSIGLGQLIIEAFGDRASNAGHEGNASRAPTVDNGVAGSSRVAGVSVTNVTSVMSTPATTPTQTTAVFARGVSRKWSRKKIGFGVAMSTIFITLV